MTDVDIDIYADVVCPWCWIGKRRLEQALATYDGDVTIRFRPFQLDPSTPEQPKPLIDALAPKFGGRDRTQQIFAHTTGVAAEVGLTMHFDHAVMTNTFEAHRLIWFATSHSLGTEMIEAIHRAHFTDGVDIGSHDALAALAAGVGLDEVEVRDFLASTAGTTEVRAEMAAAHEVGVTSVPTFVFAGKYAVTGAQDAETLRGVLDEVTRREADLVVARETV